MRKVLPSPYLLSRDGKVYYVPITYNKFLQSQGKSGFQCEDFHEIHNHSIFVDISCTKF